MAGEQQVAASPIVIGVIAIWRVRAYFSTSNSSDTVEVASSKVMSGITKTSLPFRRNRVSSFIIPMPISSASAIIARFEVECLSQLGLRHFGRKSFEGHIFESVLLSGLDA